MDQICFQKERCSLKMMLKIGSPACKTIIEVERTPGNIVFYVNYFIAGIGSCHATRSCIHPDPGAVFHAVRILSANLRKRTCNYYLNHFRYRVTIRIQKEAPPIDGQPSNNDLQKGNRVFEGAVTFLRS